MKKYILEHKSVPELTKVHFAAVLDGTSEMSVASSFPRSGLELSLARREAFFIFCSQNPGNKKPPLP
ncbi:hypothetical protein N2599_04860 [Rhizobium sullae]|uniref:Uncharacterized protein n=1 Tax=Rhizobium sullae TaxID=50338 RepID=A0ABY5XLK3_RHISU|nr:hypothetical protein [Rhizobium sullae]UWU15343.1 hypothetical protein N2599_04860 [Rhizobium sullae]